MRITSSKAATLEAIRPASGGSFEVRRVRPACFPFQWHYHPEMELTLIVRGHGMRFVGTSIEAFGSGDVVLIGSNVPHTWQSQDGQGHVEAVVVQFAADLWTGLERLPEMAAIRRVLHRAGQGLVILPGNMHEQISASMNAMTAMAGSARCVAELLRCIAMASEAPGSQTRTLMGSGSDWSGVVRPRARKIQRVLNRVHAALSEGNEVTQAEAAEWVTMSAASFSRSFKRELGVSFRRYVNEWRVGLACQSLVNTPKAITEIAFECGFGNLSNFNRRFREIKGKTPSAFRAVIG